MDSQLKNKLTRFESTPPPGAWDKIAEALNDGAALGERLYNYAPQPPLSVWDSIENNLDEERPAKIVPFFTKYSRPVRYAAAASIIAVILISSTLLFKRTEAGAIDAGSTATVPVNTQSVLPQVQSSSTPVDNVGLAESLEDKTRSEAPTFRKRLMQWVRPQMMIASVAIGRNFFPKKVTKDPIVNNTALNNYMVYTDDNGHTMRLPKKLFPLVDCQDGDAACAERIKALQKKLSSTALTTDFGAVLEMLRQMQ